MITVSDEVKKVLKTVIEDLEFVRTFVELRNEKKTDAYLNAYCEVIEDAIEIVTKHYEGKTQGILKDSYLEMIKKLSDLEEGTDKKEGESVH